MFILPSPDVISLLSPGTKRIILGNLTFNSDAAPRILKDAASLATGGWAVYVVKTAEQTAEYGVFRALTHSFATGAEEAMLETKAQSPVVLIRNRGRLVVELRNAKGQVFTACFTSAAPSESVFAKNVLEFASVAASAVSADQVGSFVNYLSRLLADLLQHCHGALLAAHVPTQDGRPTDALKDGLWLPGSD